MNNRIVAVLGGDKRDLQVVTSLLENNWKVQTFGLPTLNIDLENIDLQNYENSSLKVCKSIREAIENVFAIILPMSGVKEDGSIYSAFLNDIRLDENDFADLPKEMPVICGIASNYLKELGRKYNFNIIEVAEIDEVAIPNGIPTAEGAIQIAMEEMPVTIEGIRAMVLGFGRIGKPLAEKLRGLNASLYVINRKGYAFAEAERENFNIYTFEEMRNLLPKMDLIINTVPKMILPKDLLPLIKKDCLIIDLASKPGGVDFQFGDEIGLNIIHALGLPGKVAPKTAGKILGNYYPKLLEMLYKNEIK